MTMNIGSWYLVRLTVSIAAVVALGCQTASQVGTPGPVDVKLIAFNDLHGYIEPPGIDLNLDDPDQGKPATVHLGGAAYLATLVKQLKAENPNSMIVGVGDLVGASPAISAWTMDEATIDIMGRIGMEISPVGNHEFDRGKAELLRLQNGGCATLDPVTNPHKRTCINGPFEGASFKYLAANVTDNDSGQLLFPATYARKFGNVTIGFIGLTLKDTAQATIGAVGLTFGDEVEVITRYAKELRAGGADAVVVLLHQGGATTATKINDKTCPGLTGGIKTIVERLSANDVDVVVSGHSHKEYVCEINGILLTQASYYGTMVTDINLTITPGEGVIARSANSLPVINGSTTGTVPRGYSILEPDPVITKVVADYDALTAADRQAEIGYAAEPIERINDSSGSRINVVDHPLGRVIADAYFAKATLDDPADFAVMNPGAIRASVLTSNVDGKVTYDDLFAIAPFAGELYLVKLKGEHVIRLLEQQWEQNNCNAKQYMGMCGRVLQPSYTLTYTWKFDKNAQGKPDGTGNVVVRDSVKINGVALDPDKTYRIITNDYLALEGGDYFSAFTLYAEEPAKNMVTSDIQALIDYVGSHPKQTPLAKPSLRIQCDGCAPIP